MYRPGRGIDLFTPLVQMWALIAYLWRPPDKPVTPRGRIWLRVASVVVAFVATAAGVLFAVMTFSEGGPQAWFWTACFTFGLFGLPTSAIAIVIGALLVHAKAAPDTAHSAAAILLALTYFAQWLLLAAALFRRSRTR